MPLEYSGKVALVTGAARGIGLAIARRFAVGGALVVIADIKETAGLSAVNMLESIGGNARFLAADLSLPGAAADMVHRCAAEAGRLDVLVNNARAGRRLDLTAESEENWDLALSVGLKSAFFASQAAIAAMARTGGGCIVNIASVAAVLATHESPSYHVAKAGLTQLTRYLAVAAGANQVRVNCVMPGFIVQDDHRTRYDEAGNEAYRRMAEFYHPMGRVGNEGDIAELIAFLCSDRARYISGACLPLDGAATVQEQFGMLMRWPGNATDK